MPMKQGSGNLDFGSGDDSDDEPDDEPHQSDAIDDSPDDRDVSEPGAMRSDVESADPVPEDNTEYPYFVRRTKVGDERDDRIEVHLRTEVSDQESAFRSELADALETGEVSKTDAREFALKYAFENPEGVAELMREEGYGLTD